MSLEKVSGDGLGAELEGLSFEQIKKKLITSFAKVLGRYESVSGRVWAEVFQNETDDKDEAIIWRKGIGNEVVEDVKISHPEAMMKFMDLVGKGYSKVFKGVTQADMDKGNAMREQKQSAPQREGWLGIYYKGSNFFRISQFKPEEYYIEYGYDTCTTRSMREDERGARFELDVALDKGFAREGEEVIEYTNPLAIFGLEIDTDESKEEKEKRTTANGDFPDFLFD